MSEERKHLSEVLIDAMKARGMSTEKLAEETGISDRFLESLLGENFEKLPSKPYVHGYLVKISEALGLNGEHLWQEYLKDAGNLRGSGHGDELPGDAAPTQRFNRFPLVIGIIVIVIIFVYGFVQVQTFIQEPTLKLEGLEKDSITLSETTFMLRGEISPEDQLSLNGEDIFTDQEGKFEKNIEFQPGFNTLNFTVKKFLGKEYTIVKQVFVEKNEDVESDVTEPEESVE